MINEIFQEEEFTSRHIGPDEEDRDSMLRTIGVDSLDALIDQTVPASIRMRGSLKLAPARSEHQFLKTLRDVARKNKVYKSMLGQGYYGCVTPSVIQRNIFENPGWYTQYTPYQPEISQGRLEALLNFQTMVTDLTGMEVANASLLDEGTSAAEAMTMAFGIVNKRSDTKTRDRFFVSHLCFSQTIDVIKTRGEAVGIEIVVGDHTDADIDDSYFGAIVQYPDNNGAVVDYRAFIASVHKAGALAIVAADILSLALLTPPGEFGADVVVGSTQRFGVPMGYGGPHAAYFATKNEFIRHMPGRIIGVSVDAQNNRAYRMTLQTREQHIRREKATSNICTAQALLAIMAGMYAVYHGPGGIKKIASRVHTFATLLDRELTESGFRQLNTHYFDTLLIDAGKHADAIYQAALAEKIDLRRIDATHIGVSFDETTELNDVVAVKEIFAHAAHAPHRHDDVGKKYSSLKAEMAKPFGRSSPYLQHPVFSMYHSEPEMMRYIKTLENKDLSLTHSMIPLGSCTMKLNAASELLPVSWHEFAHLHPFAPLDQAEGYQQIFRELESDLCEISGLAAASLQPNSGAQGEFTGLLVIRAFHADRGERNRNVALIPSSAHGTNPASAVMAGLKVVVVACDENGNIDLADLRAKAETHGKNLAALMVTYPSTHGVFEEEIKEICSIVHRHGGQVYMDGANLNAQVGLTSPGMIGADVCHINLHKTFSIPHGGGGPGMGPICVAAHLAPYLPGHSAVRIGSEKSIHAVASAPWSSASILLITHAYIKMLGPDGVKEATEYAILNANYLKARLEPYFKILYEGKNGRVAHEFILDMKEFKERCGVDVEDISKRLMDYGFHAPTVSFPVHDTLMMEPTESESKAELDRFADALISIKKEMEEIASGNADPKNNVLKNAPHTAAEAAKDEWDHPYPRSKAVYPLASVRQHKFWPSVGRINNTYGDKNVMCVCPPISSYVEEPVS
ncbi:MAG TPA: aminomethyl-transferring glycine dehydrogenase [Bacteroidota bacterium]|nr:aminomethyl-transferring glycine dehydrogenase [Bacteroidota bacterium]